MTVRGEPETTRTLERLSRVRLACRDLMASFEDDRRPYTMAGAADRDWEVTA